MSSEPEYMVALRRRLADLGVREIVERDASDENERIMLYGLCTLCRTPRWPRFRAWLDDHDVLHAEHRLFCGCNEERTAETVSDT